MGIAGVYVGGEEVGVGVRAGWLGSGSVSLGKVAPTLGVASRVTLGAQAPKRVVTSNPPTSQAISLYPLPFKVKSLRIDQRNLRCP